MLLLLHFNNKNINVKIIENNENDIVEYKNVIYTNKYDKLENEKIDKIDESRRKNKVLILDYLVDKIDKNWDELNSIIEDMYNLNLNISNLITNELINIKDSLKIDEFISLIKTEIKKDLSILQKANNGELFNIFKKNNKNITEEYLKEFKNFTKSFGIKQLVGSDENLLINFISIIKNINKLKITDLKKIDNETKYLFDLFNFYRNYNNYLDDNDEYKLDDYFIPVIKEIFEKIRRKK